MTTLDYISKQDLEASADYQAFVAVAKKINANTSAKIEYWFSDYLDITCQSLGTVFPHLDDDNSIDHDEFDKSRGVAYCNGEEYWDFDLIYIPCQGGHEMYDTRGWEVCTLAELTAELERLYQDTHVVRYCTSGTCGNSFTFKVSEFEDDSLIHRCPCEQKSLYSLD